MLRHGSQLVPTSQSLFLISLFFRDQVRLDDDCARPHPQAHRKTQESRTPLGLEANTRHHRLCVLDGVPELCAADLRARSRNHRFPRDESPVHPRRALWVKWNQWSQRTSRTPWRHDIHQVRRSGSVRRRNVRDPRLPGGSPERHGGAHRIRRLHDRTGRVTAQGHSASCYLRSPLSPRPDLQSALHVLYSQEVANQHSRRHSATFA